MNELKRMLNNVNDSYYDFVVAVLTYANKKEARTTSIKKFIADNPNATTSEILSFISEQNDFWEDNISVPEITVQEFAEHIADDDEHNEVKEAIIIAKELATKAAKDTTKYSTYEDIFGENFSKPK